MYGTRRLQSSTSRASIRLSPYSPEEIVSREYLIDDRPDVVINLVDATNLERNLYLTTQILTLGLPVVMALNMMDVVEKNGDKIDVEGLSEKLGCPIVGISALRNRGTEELMAAVEKAAQSHQLLRRACRSRSPGRRRHAGRGHLGELGRRRFEDVVCRQDA